MSVVERRTGILEIPRPQLWLGRRNKHCYQNEPTDKGNEAHDQFQHRSLSLRLAPDPFARSCVSTTRLLEFASVRDVRSP